MQSLMTIRLAFAANIPRRVVRRGAEFSKLKREREDRLYQILMSRKVEWEHMRKMIYYVKRLEERQRKSREEEEARQREGNLYIIFNVWSTSSDFLSISLALPLILMNWLLVTWHYDFEEAERRRKEEAELKAKQDEIYEKQKQCEKELEEKKGQQIEEVLGRSPAAAAPARPTENPVVSQAAEVGLASAPTTGKYVPRFKRASRESAAPPPQPCPAETERWGSRADDRAPQHTDRWGRDFRKPSSFGSSGSPRSTWPSPRSRGERQVKCCTVLLGSSGQNAVWGVLITLEGTI